MARLSKAREAEHLARVAAFMREPAEELKAELTAVREERDALVKAATLVRDAIRNGDEAAILAEAILSEAIAKIEAAEKESDAT
jgi:predicted  nucleic acid-binding Zn-ribbon protein